MLMRITLSSMPDAEANPYLLPLVTLFASSFAAHGLDDATALDAARQVVAGLPAGVADALDARGIDVAPHRVIEHSSALVAALVEAVDCEWPFHLRSPGERAHVAEVA